MNLNRNPIGALSSLQTRLIIDPPLPGAWNMAVDEMLLESAAAGSATLRFYQWSEPTLSLGYFQPLAAREQHQASSACPVVRRASGGGAILHDGELTYSFVAPLGSRLSASAGDLYGMFHASLIETLAEFGLVARLWSLDSAARQRRDEPFLCFARRARGDVLCGANKICGSAQRRSKGAVLQHGSVLLESSPHAPELPGIRELRGVTISGVALQTCWTSRLARLLKLSLISAELDDSASLNRIRQIAADQFSNREWTARR